ncbi:hypothetical protein F4818DRAFT_407343 [Hypoxylon cercidicola]|nr:hypothetical protein F4818DRAFT_407343 [Hypoxylon cercidicola]
MGSTTGGRTLVLPLLMILESILSVCDLTSYKCYLLFTTYYAQLCYPRYDATGLQRTIHNTNLPAASPGMARISSSSMHGIGRSSTIHGYIRYLPTGHIVQVPTSASCVGDLQDLRTGVAFTFLTYQLRHTEDDRTSRGGNRRTSMHGVKKKNMWKRENTNTGF